MNHDQESNAVLAEYLRRLDAGESVDLEAICQSHPEISAELRSYVDGDAMVAEFLQDSNDQKPQSAEPVEVTPSQETVRPGMSRETDSILASKMFGRYQIKRPLGEGAMGTVYLAEDSKLNRLVALKIPKFGIGNKEEFLARFQREAQSAANLKHPGICPVYDIGEH